MGLITHNLTFTINSFTNAKNYQTMYNKQKKINNHLLLAFHTKNMKNKKLLKFIQKLDNLLYLPHNQQYNNIFSEKYLCWISLFNTFTFFLPCFSLLRHYIAKILSWSCSGKKMCVEVHLELIHGRNWLCSKSYLFFLVFSYIIINENLHYRGFFDVHPC